MDKIELHHIEKEFTNLNVDKNLFFDSYTNMGNELKMMEEINNFNQNILDNKETEMKERIKRDLGIVNSLIEKGFKINIPYITFASERDSATKWSTLLSRNVIIGKGSLKVFPSDHDYKGENGFFYKGKGTPEEFARALANYLVTITSLAFSVNDLKNSEKELVINEINTHNKTFFNKLFEEEVKSLHGKKLKESPQFLNNLGTYKFTKRLIEDIADRYFNKINDFSDLYELLGEKINEVNVYEKSQKNKMLVDIFVESGIRNIYKEKSEDSVIMSMMSFVKAYKRGILDESIFKDKNILETAKVAMYSMYKKESFYEKIWWGEKEDIIDFFINFARNGHKLSCNLWGNQEDFFIAFWKKFLKVNESEVLARPEVTDETFICLNNWNNIQVDDNLVLIDKFFKKEDLLLGHIISKDLENTGKYEVILTEKDLGVINGTLTEIRKADNELRGLKKLYGGLKSGSIIVEFDDDKSEMIVKINQAEKEYLNFFVSMTLSVFVNGRNKNLYTKETYEMNQKTIEEKIGLLRENMIQSLVEDKNSVRVKRKI